MTSDPRSSVRLSNTDRANALRCAIEQLDWLLDPKFTRYRNALEWVGDTATQSQVVTSDYERVGSRPKGTISDPTGEAVVKSVELGGRRISLTERAASRTRELTHLAAVIGESAGHVVDTVRATLYDEGVPHPLLKLDAAKRALEYAAKVGAHGHRANETARQLRQCDRLEDASEFDHAIRLTDESCRSLAQMCGTFLRERAFTEEAPKPQQKAINECRIHAQHGHHVHADSDRNQHLCAQCANFRTNHGCDPTGPILKRWEYGQGPTPGQMVEARAQGKRKKQSA